MVAGVGALAALATGCTSSSSAGTAAPAKTFTVTGRGGAGGAGAGGSGAAGGATGTGGTGGTASTGNGGSGGWSPPALCATGGAEIDKLPDCAAGPLDTIAVPAGCAPVIDGVLHAEEWGDGTCFDVGGSGAPDMVVRMKIAGDSLYFATSGLPTCSCGMKFYFDPSGMQGLDGDEFAVSVMDDPFLKDGNRSDFVFQAGKLVAGNAPGGIETACPGNLPNPVRYEWRLPLSALGAKAGTTHPFRFAIVHAEAKWPAGLTVDGNGAASTPGTWGVVKPATAW
jgi:hypothetical protein